MTINKLIIYFFLALFNLLLNSYSFAAEDNKEKDLVLEEELPAVNPFLGGASSASGGGSLTGADNGNASLIDNLKLNGIIKGGKKRFAIFSLPDGRTVRYEENTVVNPDLMVLDIFIDRVYLKINEEEYSIDLLNQITKVEG